MSAPFMQLYVADYLGDTRHLTTEQHGAYLLLLMTMWRSEGRLPNDAKKLARITGCTASRWARISDDVLAFFEVDGDDLTNKRLMLELEKASEKSIQRAVSGSKGGKAKALKTNKPSVAKATGLLCHSSEPEPDTKEATAPFVAATKSPRPAKRCPDGWLPSTDDVEVGESKGLSPGDIVEELAKFKDHTFGTARSDWSATFRNWLREAARRSRPRTPNARLPNTRAEARSVWSDIAADENAARSGGDGPRLRLAG